MAEIELEQYNPFLKKNVYGNVLDQVNNYQYNAKLYMIPPVANGSSQEKTDESGDDARADTPDTTATDTSQGGYLQDYLIASPSETVILAQTGVTGTQIDNISIHMAVGPGNSQHIERINFDIVQPGAVDFLDQIMAAKAHLGDRVYANDTPLFLEIVFKGYSEDIDDVTAGGEPITAAGPYRFRMSIATVSLEITANGSEYNFSCVPTDTMAYTDKYYRVPKQLESVGTTIEEHITDFVAKLNKHYQDSYNDYQIQDEVVIDISGLTEGEYALNDLSITSNEDTRAEEVNRIMNPETEGVEANELKDILVEVPKDEGTGDVNTSGKTKITVREGITIDRYIATLLSMNDDFFSRITRKKNPSDPGDTEVDKSQPFINWFKINAGVQYIEYDKRRKSYAKKIFFKPTIYATGKTVVQISADENTNLPKDAIETRVNGLNILKAYNYFYTGLNDQIINCAIQYKPGISLLTAPSGGAAGDYSTTNAAALSSSATADEDLTGEDIATEAIRASTQGTLQGFISDLFDNVERAADLKSFATDVLGFSAAEAADAIANKTGLNATIISSILTDRQQAELARNVALNQAKKNTSSDNQTNPDGTAYTPTLSGYVYAADIIGNVAERLDAAAAEERLTETVKQQRTDVENEDESGNSSPEPSVESQYRFNPAEDATYDGTPRNTLFGYIMHQHAGTDFMVKLDMEIKGDPWYLGKTSEDSVAPDRAGALDVSQENASNSTSANFAGNDNYVLFNMQTPRRFDFDVEDEDNNTGYWTQEGTAYFISGIYFVNEVTHNFSSGEFTQDIRLIKLDPLQLNKLDKESKDTGDEE